MQIQELKNQVEQWPRNRRGRLKLTMEKKQLIEQVFRSSNLRIQSFAQATGLNEQTVSKILNVGLKKTRGFQPPVKAAFHSVSIAQGAAWSVMGPRGLKVECKNLAQVAELWRSLC